MKALLRRRTCNARRQEGRESARPDSGPPVHDIQRSSAVRSTEPAALGGTMNHPRYCRPAVQARADAVRLRTVRAIPAALYRGPSRRHELHSFSRASTSRRATARMPTSSSMRQWMAGRIRP
jgi:hypothetical protein